MKVLLVLALALAACSVSHKSQEYSCTTNADCATHMGTVCDNGFCVVPGTIDAPGTRPDAPRGDAPNGCPAGCTSCNVSQKTCTIDCSQTNVVNCMNSVQCPVGYHCDIQCKGDNTCRNGVSCVGAASCSIECIGGSSCRNVECGTGPCDVTCSGTSSCRDVSCNNSCACDVLCTGSQSCSSTLAACHSCM